MLCVRRCGFALTTRVQQLRGHAKGDKKALDRIDRLLSKRAPMFVTNASYLSDLIRARALQRSQVLAR